MTKTAKPSVTITEEQMLGVPEGSKGAHWRDAEVGSNGLITETEIKRGQCAYCLAADERWVAFQIANFARAD